MCKFKMSTMRNALYNTKKYLHSDTPALQQAETMVLQISTAMGTVCEVTGIPAILTTTTLSQAPATPTRTEIVGTAWTLGTMLMVRAPPMGRGFPIASATIEASATTA